MTRFAPLGGRGRPAGLGGTPGTTDRTLGGPVRRATPSRSVGVGDKRSRGGARVGPQEPTSTIGGT